MLELLPLELCIDVPDVILNIQYTMILQSLMSSQVSEFQLRPGTMDLALNNEAEILGAG